MPLLSRKAAITARDIERTLKLGVHYREQINATESLDLRLVGEPDFIKAPRAQPGVESYSAAC